MLAAGRLAAALRAVIFRNQRRFFYPPPRPSVPRQPSEACRRTPMDEHQRALDHPLLIECMVDE